jgi:2,4-dienoyl-CoA reductase-like NADH-dependent reductase (Old Yellow Enzyme family)
VILNDRLVFFLGVNTGYVSKGKPDHRYISFYRRRSSPQVHCTILGNVVIPGGYGSNDTTPLISRDAVWADVAQEIRGAGSLPGIQLATAWAGYHGSRSFRSTGRGQVIAEARKLVSSMESADVSRVFDNFDEGAKLAGGQGFGHVQVHSAHGYLLSLLIDSRINADASRALDRLGRLAEQLRHDGMESSIRISLRSGDPDFDSSGREDLYQSVAALPFDFIDISSGFYNIDKQLIYPARQDTLEARRRDTIDLAVRYPAKSFIFSGRALNHSTTDLPPNIHIGLCRDLIANPRFLTELDNGCRNHSKCHYFSRGVAHLTCPRWPDTGGDSS